MGRSVDRDALRALLRDQDGLVSLAQAAELGVTSSMVAGRVASGQWVRAGHRVYRAADHPDTMRVRVRAAVLSVGDDAVLVGRTALWWWRLDDDEPSVIEVAVGGDRRPRPRAGVRVVLRAIPAEHRIVVDGLPTAKRAVAALTAVASMPLLEGASLLDRLLGDGAVTLDELRTVHFDRIGARGAPRIRQLIVLAGGRARSEAERVAHRQLRRAGITGWTVNRRIRLAGFGVVELDLAFEARKVALEIDGWAFHRTLRAFLRDARRQNALTVAGWTVVRTNWHQLTREPEAVLATVRAVLDARPAVPAPTSEA